jgi:hypothetical protein
MDSIFKNVKTVEEGREPSSVTICLNFPYSVSEYTGGYKKDGNDIALKRQFNLSYNDAINSQFLKTMLEDFPENVTYCEITIPKNLYLGIRLIDINCLYELWTSRITITHALIYDDKYHLKDVCRLADALLLSKEFPFMRKLYEKYTHADMYMVESII